MATVTSRSPGLRGDDVRRQDLPAIPLSYYGVRADGTTEDDDAWALAIAAAPTGSVLEMPRSGRSIITTPIQITKTLSIVGSNQYASGITAIGCGAIEVTAGVSSVRIENIDIAAAVRHSTTPNAYVGIRINGNTGARPSNWLLRDVLMDGFHTALYSDYLWSSVFDNYRTAYCHTGLKALGLSVTNFVTNCSITGENEAGSTGILLGDGVTASEGWGISHSLIYGFKRGVHGKAFAHCKVIGCELDHCYEYGLLLEAGASNFAGSWEVIGNWIGMTGASGVAGIANMNDVANATYNRGSAFQSNRIIVYVGQTCNYGIYLDHANSGEDDIAGNNIFGMAQADIWTANSPSARIGSNTTRSTAPALGNVVSATPMTAIFTASGTWTKPLNARSVSITAIGGGGGGGSGRRGAAGSVRCGGGGGAGGEGVQQAWNADQVPATLTITVDAGGAGGAAITADDTNGNNGTAGGRSSAVNGTWKFGASGGAAGSGGSAISGAGGVSGTNNTISSSQGASADANGGGGVAVAANFYPPKIGAAGGGSGAGITAADVESYGGTGGTQSGWDSIAAGGTGPGGATGTAGANSPTGVHLGGAGGAGGGSAAGGGGAGGAGGTYGGGGGGGGASTNAAASGAGGAGAAGAVIIVCTF